MTTRTFYARDQVHSITIEPDGSWTLTRSGYTIDSYRVRSHKRTRSRASERRMKQTADHIFEKKCIPYYHNLGE